MSPSSIDVLFGVTDAARDILVSTDELDGVAVLDVSLAYELDWLVTFCENTSLDDTTDDIELELSPVAVAMEDVAPTLTELEVATSEASKLDDTATVLDTGLDFSPEAIGSRDTTPVLSVPDEAATVEGCSDTPVDDCIVALFETTELDTTPTGLGTEVDDDWLVAPTAVIMEDLTSTTTELDIATGDACRGTLEDDSKSDVFTTETV